MARFQDTGTSEVGSSTHLLWLATMGLKDHYHIVSKKEGLDVIYNNGMRFIAIDILINMKRDNAKKENNA